MQSPTKLFGPILALAAALLPLSAIAQEATGRVVLVLPFDNRTGNPSLSWIGDSFPDTLNKRLSSAGFLTISQDDRRFALDHLGLPVDFRPSRATTIRIAQQLDANIVVIGSFKTQPDAAGGDRIMIQARVLFIDTLKLSPVVEDSAPLNRLFDGENAIAWKVARSIDPQFNVAEPTFLSASSPVPLPAFENYIRGTNATTAAERLKRLQAAANAIPNYSAALLALGKEQYAQRDFDHAAQTLARVPQTDRLALEAGFYLGLSRFTLGNYAGAQQAFGFVATRLPLSEVVNDEAVAESRQGMDGIAGFQRAADIDPSEEDYRYNLAVADFRRGDTTSALLALDAALKLKPADNEAIDLRNRLKANAPGTKLSAVAGSTFSPLERIRRNYSEASFRQAAFQLDQLRALRMADLKPAERAAQYNQLGQDYLTQGLLPEAETQFQAALQADPSSADAHAGLARIRELSADPDRARQEAIFSNRLAPNVAAFLVLARLDMLGHLFPAAADDVAHILKLDPNNTEAIAIGKQLDLRGQVIPQY
jgi:tetratricopeptide (TPR) repeat protein